MFVNNEEVKILTPEEYNKIQNSAHEWEQNRFISDVTNQDFNRLAKDLMSGKFPSRDKWHEIHFFYNAYKKNAIVDSKHKNTIMDMFFEFENELNDKGWFLVQQGRFLTEEGYYACIPN